METAIPPSSTSICDLSDTSNPTSRYSDSGYSTSWDSTYRHSLHQQAVAFLIQDHLIMGYRRIVLVAAIRNVFQGMHAVIHLCCDVLGYIECYAPYVTSIDWHKLAAKRLPAYTKLYDQVSSVARVFESSNISNSIISHRSHFNLHHYSTKLCGIGDSTSTIAARSLLFCFL